MSWKYQQFAQEAVFQAEREIVCQAVRAFAGDWLADWKVSETPDGLEARGYSAGHLATARFRIESGAVGTKVAVELQVERASPLGFMLVDVGGYYNGQIRKWLQALPWWVQQKQTQGQAGEAVPAGPPMAKPSPGPNLFMGCVLLFVVLGVCVYAIAALVGLLTGNLYIPGRGSGGTVVHGMWARILSAIILLFLGWIALRIWKPKRRNGSGWLPPP
jgi:hypothetical protein